MKLSGKWMAGSLAWAFYQGQWENGIVERVGRKTLTIYLYGPAALVTVPAEWVRPRSTHQRGNDRPAAKPQMPGKAKTVRA